MTTSNIFQIEMVTGACPKPTCECHCVLSSTAHLGDITQKRLHPLRDSVIGQLLHLETKPSIRTIAKRVEISTHYSKYLNQHSDWIPK